MEWLMILAVLLSPLIALQVQILLERYRSYSRRQHEVFRMLMATRGTRLSPTHIDALNRIDLEFWGRRILRMRWQSKAEKQVIEAWRAYHNNLGVALPQGGDDNSAFFQKRWDLFISLMHAISKACGYDFDQTHLQEMSYTPTFFGNVEADQTTIRESLASVLSGKKPIPVALIADPEALRKQELLQNALISHIGPDGALRVRLVADVKEVTGLQKPN